MKKRNSKEDKIQLGDEGYVKFNFRRDILITFACILILVLAIYISFFSEIVQNFITFPLMHGSSYGKGFLMLSALALISIILTIAGILINRKINKKKTLLFLRQKLSHKKILCYLIVFVVLIITIAFIGLNLELKIADKYMEGREETGYWSLKKYTPLIRVYEPSKQILYGTTSSFHSHSLKSMFYQPLPESIKQDFWFDLGSATSVLVEDESFTLPLILWCIALILLIMSCLMIYMHSGKQEHALLWGFISVGLLTSSIDGGLLSNGLLVFAAMFLVYIFLFYIIDTYIESYNAILCIFFFSLLTFFRDVLVSMFKLSTAVVKLNERSAYFIVMAIMLLLFLRRNNTLKSQWKIKKRMALRLGEKKMWDFDMGIVKISTIILIILISINCFNLFVLAFFENIGVNKVAFLSPNELDPNLGGTMLVMQDNRAHIYTLESDKILTRQDMVKIKSEIDSYSTKEILKTIELCYPGQVRTYFKEIYDAPILSPGQHIGPMNITEVTPMGDHITKISYDCSCAACYFVYNPLLRQMTKRDYLISFSYMMKRGVDSKAYYLELMVPF